MTIASLVIDEEDELNHLLSKNVFIPLKVAAIVSVPTGTRLCTVGCSFSNVVATLSLGTFASIVGIAGVIGSE